MFDKKAKKLFASASLFTSLLILSGCGVWTDFTTYFNTYYNAKTLFDRVEEEILLQKKDIFVFREDLQTGSLLGGPGISQFNQESGLQGGTQFNQQNQNPQFASQQGDLRSSPLLSGSINENLKKVIEKCSKILQYEKNSSYFADALFITGKALYYQQEYARSQRKFNELAGLGKTKYSSENKLWLAKTDLQLRNFDEGLKLIDEVKVEAINDSNDKLFNDASITKISFLIFRKDFPGAIIECKNFLKESKDEEIAALVSYQMGMISLSLNDQSTALSAFSDVLKYEPTVDVEFKSRFESAKILKNLKRVDESEAVLEDLRYLGKYKNYVDEVMIELGKIYYDKNEPDKAIDLFREVDTTYKQRPTSGMAALKLAETYHRKLGLYDSASVNYIKASISMSTSEVRSAAAKQAVNFNKYFAYKDEEKSLNRDLDYLEDISNYMRDSIDYAIAYREYLDKVKAFSESQKSDPNLISQVEISFASQEQQYKQQLIALMKRPRKGMVLTEAEQIGLGKYKKPERPVLSADSIKTVLSKSLYNLASLFYSELDVPDSAHFYFKKIIKEFPTKRNVLSQTMFALGTFYETNNDSVKADSLFRYIYDNFEKDPLRNAAAEKLGLVKKDVQKTLIKKEEDPAEPSYVKAEQIYFNKDYYEAIDSFRSVYKRFPESAFAPKSLYYMGIIYEKDLKMYDSAASAYKFLTLDYSKSQLASAVMPKYNEYKKEKDRLLKEEENKRLELEKKQKEAEQKSKEKETKVSDKINTAVPEKISPPETNIINDDLLLKNRLKNDSTSLKDSSKIKIEKDSLMERSRTPVDTSKIKLNKIID